MDINLYIRRENDRLQASCHGAPSLVTLSFESKDPAVVLNDTSVLVASALADLVRASSLLVAVEKHLPYDYGASAIALLMAAMEHAALSKSWGGRSEYAADQSFALKKVSEALELDSTIHPHVRETIQVEVLGALHSLDRCASWALHLLRAEYLRLYFLARAECADA